MIAPRNTSLVKSSTVLWIIAGFLLLVFGGLLIAELTPLLFPPQASAQAQQVDDLFKFLLAVGAAIFLLVQGVLVVAIVRFRACRGDRSDGVPMHGNATLEVVWTLIPAVIVLVITIYSFQVWVNTTAARADEQTVRATGARFVWSFAYDDPVNNITINSKELHTYVGQPVRMEMSTDDSQHAFWIPAMRIKQDLLPGRVTEVRFTPTRAGSYPIVCAELCGSGHGQMRATIVVHPDEATYLSWFDDAVNTALNPPADPVERGRALLAAGAYPCSGCHVLDDLGWQGITGPSLNGVGDRAGRRVPGQTAEEYLDRSIYFPAEYLVPGFGNLMPQFQPNDPNAPNYMPPDDHLAIVAYLCTLTASGESACDLDNLERIVSEYR
ncbi:MAG: cytochrome c oxidase subunit II [Aggregatilineales bacterium]